MMLSVFTESSFPLLPNEKDGDKTPKPSVVVVMNRVCDCVKTHCKKRRGVRGERAQQKCACVCVCLVGLN